MDIDLQKKSNGLKNALLKNQDKFRPVINIPENFYIFDFTENNRELLSLDLGSTEKFSEYISGILEKNNCDMGIGRYNEDRIIYKRSQLFADEAESRSLHLGIDIWTKEDTPIFSPLPAKVHSFQDNNNFGDYGPTIILEHELDNIKFYTLYGHLSRKSLEGLSKGKQFKSGNEVATVGTSDINGNWPTHLHFEIITDMLEKFGDFPGVARPSEREYYLDLCPDPNLILKLDLK